MQVHLKAYDPQRHSAETVAGLIYDADPELMALGYGPREKGVRILCRLMRLASNQYSAENILCAQRGDETVGVLVGFTGAQKRRHDRESGADYFRSFGLWHMLALLPRAGTLQRIVTQQVADDEYCVFGLSVAPAYRNQGIGSLLLGSVLQRYQQVCLDVNIHNEAAQRFYVRHGFRLDGENSTVWRGLRIGNYCMRRP